MNTESQTIVNAQEIAPVRPISRSQRLSALARSFPSLREADGVAPFEPRVLEKWACASATNDYARHAACLVLHLYNARTPWKIGRFDVLQAMRAWDDDHRLAFLAWVKEPFFT